MRFLRKFKGFGGFFRNNKPGIRFKVLYCPSSKEDFDQMLPEIVDGLAELSAAGSGFCLISAESLDYVTGEVKNLLPEIELAAIHRYSRIQDQD